MIPIVELRIHNLVSITESARKELFDCNEVLFEKNIHQVTGLDIDELRLFIDSMEVEFDYSQIEPIELTKEWLKKAGFDEATHEGNDVMIYSKSEWNFVLEYYNFQVKSESSWFLVQYLGQLEIKIQFIHQLQNLYFALTNKELTIK